MYDDKRKGYKAAIWENLLVMITALLTIVIADSPAILLWMQNHTTKRTASVSLVVLTSPNKITTAVLDSILEQPVNVGCRSAM